MFSHVDYTVRIMFLFCVTEIMRALIVVDYQNDFVCGSLGFEKAKELEDPIEKKILSYIENEDMVVFTKDMHDKEKYPQTQEGKLLPIPHCVDDDGSAIYGKIAQYCNEENTVTKDRFGSEDLCARLSFYPGIEEMEIVGVVGSICVMTNAVLLKTNFPEVKITVDAACVASPDESMNSKALDVMENLQINVINRSEL